MLVSTFNMTVFNCISKTLELIIEITFKNVLSKLKWFS